MISKITSIKDERIVEARSLASSSGRKKTGKILLEGEQIIQWALNSDWRVSRVFFCEKNISNHSFLNSLVENHIDCDQVTEGIIKKISATKYVIFKKDSIQLQDNHE
jgi:tRNA G18 (ribose-2'-O)-methylase SpoU